MKGVPWSGWSLRSKLIVACVLVQLVAAALVLLGSTQLLQRALLDQASSQAKQIVALLDYAIAAPLAQRDYATLQQSLDLIRSDESITYLVLSDHRGKLIATAGWDAARPLPSRDEKGIDLERPDATMHLALPVSLAGQPLGHVDFGLSTAGLRQARADFLRHSLGITGAALAISMALLTVIAFAITHRLTRLAHASQRVARGDLDATVPVTSNDEVGRLGISFNAMAETLKLRVAALEHSETQQRLLLKAAREEQARLTTLLGAMNSGIMFVGSNGRVIYANVAFARIWALADLTTGRSLAEVVPLLIRQTIPADAVHVEAMLDTGVGKVARGVELQTVDGRIITQRMQPVAEGSSGSGCIWFHEDITLERQTQQRAYQALHDPLTKLLNRRGLYEALQAAIAQAIADNAPLALLFIDLDDFKHANDVGGHRTGDEILVAVAQTLSDQMRNGELAARLGGDEFAVLCPGNGAHAASAIAARLVEAVGGLRFAAADMQTLRIGCSIGIATCPSDARDEDDLVACADTAMYLAKQSGKNGWAVYHNDPLRSRAESARVNWNARINRALQDQRFVLHFQAVHRAADLQVTYFEALVRMVDETDPSRLISPADFVPHAELSGKVRQIDRWVFLNCARKLASTDPSVCIAANLSARSLEDATFPAFLDDTLRQLEVDPRRLHIELTETSAISDPAAARRMIDALRGLGCAVYLDDFGSGFSSFAHLKLLDVEAIKIDGAFIRDLHGDSTNRLFVASMIEIAHHLKKLAVAEHVEDASTLDILRSLGVDLVQGFHLGHPAAGISDSRPQDWLPIASATGDGELGGPA